MRVNIKPLIIFVVALGATVILGSTPIYASAQSNTVKQAKENARSTKEAAEKAKADLQAAKENHQEAKTDLKATKCENKTARIDAHINKINNAIDKQAAIYTKHDAKVDAIIAQAKAAGIDTSKAEADVSNWEAQTLAIKTQRTQILGELNALKNLQCSDQQAQFKQTLANIKIELANLRSLQAAKKAFYNSTIRPDLQAIKVQLNKQ